MAKTATKKAKRSAKAAKARKTGGGPTRKTAASRKKPDGQGQAKVKAKAKAKAKRTGGRPRGSGKWDHDGRLCRAVEASAAAGGTPADFAGLLDVPVRTVYRWLKDDGPDFKADLAEAVNAGREQATDRVERSLFDRAVGFETIERHVTADDEGTRTRTVTKVVPGDVQAQKTWLHNRRAGAWRDRQEIEGNLTVTLPEITITKTYRGAGPAGSDGHDPDDDGHAD